MPSILLGRRDNFKPGPPFIGLWGFVLKDLSRRANKLRRRVYREMPVASGNRTAELDHRMCYADIAAILEAGRLGVSSAGAALALWRACSEHGLRAWCYRFGFPESLTQTVTIVDIDGVLQIHDAFFNLSYPSGLYDVLASLRNGETVAGKRAVRDRKIYIMDPAREPGRTARWLQEHADREQYRRQERDASGTVSIDSPTDQGESEGNQEICRQARGRDRAPGPSCVVGDRLGEYAAGVIENWSEINEH